MVPLYASSGTFSALSKWVRSAAAFSLRQHAAHRVHRPSMGALHPRQVAVPQHSMALRSDSSPNVDVIQKAPHLAQSQPTRSRRPASSYETSRGFMGDCSTRRARIEQAACGTLRTHAVQEERSPTDVAAHDVAWPGVGGHGAAQLQVRERWPPRSYVREYVSCGGISGEGAGYRKPGLRRPRRCRGQHVADPPDRKDDGRDAFDGRLPVLPVLLTD